MLLVDMLLPGVLPASQHKKRFVPHIHLMLMLKSVNYYFQANMVHHDGVARLYHCMS